MKARGDLAQFSLGEVFEGFRWRVAPAPGLHEASWKMLAEQGGDFDVAPPVRRQQSLGIGPGKQVDGDRLLLLPVGRNLENGRPAHAPVRDQDVFTKLPAPAFNDRVERDAAQPAEEFLILRVECEGNKRRSELCEGEPELPRYFVTEVGRPDLGNR